MIDLTQEYKLENDRVLLRPLNKEDVRNLLQFSLNEPELWKFSLERPTSEVTLAEYIDKALAERMQGVSYPFIVFDKRTQRYAGCTRIYQIEARDKNCSIGYTWYGKEFQGTGLNKNCKFLLIEFVFECMGMERIEFRADGNNSRSIHAMKSVGCKEEGILRSNKFRPDGTRRDSVIFSMLKEEWLATEKEIQRNKIS